MKEAYEVDENANMEVEISYEQHVQQNNERLLSIKEQLNDIRGYEKGCRELLTWCADPRAFHNSFEINLLGVLNEVVTVSTRTGYDDDLAYTLLKCCHQYRKLLSRQGSMKINRWFEQLKRNRRIKNGTAVKKKNRSSNSPKKLALQQSSFGVDVFGTTNLQVETDTLPMINSSTR